MTRQLSGPDWAGKVRSTPLVALAQLWFVGSCGSGAWLPPGKVGGVPADLAAWLLERDDQSECVE